MPTRKVPGLAAALRLPDRRLDRDVVADFPAEAVGDRPAGDGALAVFQPGLLLRLGQLEFLVDRQELLGLDGNLREEVLGVLVDAAEPAVVGDDVDAGHGLEPALVRFRQRHDQADLVDQDQAIHAGQVDAERERGADRHQQSEQDERDEHGEQREDRADLLAPQAAPQQRKEFHACTTSSISCPFSRCSVRLARSAARGSCVTITIVLP